MKMQLSFDEWNVWYLKEHQEAAGVSDEWSCSPRLLEDVYTVADAVVAGSLLMTLLRHSDRVTSASLAQLVNVIAAIADGVLTIELPPVSWTAAALS
jgi:alpha-L-arabinofuranosidase